MSTDFKENKATKQQSFFFGAGSITLIAGAALVFPYYGWSDALRIGLRIALGVLDLYFWVRFAKLTNRPSKEAR